LKKNQAGSSFYIYSKGMVNPTTNKRMPLLFLPGGPLIVQTTHKTVQGTNSYSSLFCLPFQQVVSWNAQQQQQQQQNAKTMIHFLFLYIKEINVPVFQNSSLSTTTKTVMTLGHSLSRSNCVVVF
jgi:hypothetical protein